MPLWPRAPRGGSFGTGRARAPRPWTGRASARRLGTGRASAPRLKTGRASAPRRGQRGAVDLFRTAIAAFLLVGLMLTMSWLQSRYDASDHRKARALIETYRAAPSGPTIPELIARRHGVKNGEVAWSSEITSGCQGILRLTARVPAQGDTPAAGYAFDVRLTDSSIHPGDPAAIDILRALTSTASR